MKGLTGAIEWIDRPPLAFILIVAAHFAPGTAAFILANVEQARTRIAPLSPDKAPDHLSRWYLIPILIMPDR
jgi:hypothetical protein